MAAFKLGVYLNLWLNGYVVGQFCPCCLLIKNKKKPFK